MSKSILRMVFVLVPLGLVLLTASVAGADNSASTGAKISHVVWEPNEENPERIQIHGIFRTRLLAYNGPDFVMCEPIPPANWCITAPTEGFVYYWCDPAEKFFGQSITLEQCVQEWKEIVEGHESFGCVAFGDNLAENIRPPGSPAVNPEPYRRIHIGGSSFNGPYWMGCDEFEGATPPVCGDGIHHTGEWCDGNCMPEGSTCLPDSSYPCGCGRPELIGSAANCDQRCSKTTRLDYTEILPVPCFDGDGCCPKSSLVDSCEGGCCIPTDVEALACGDSDCAPGTFHEMACVTTVDCAPGEICFHPNTISSYCAEAGVTVPPDVPAPVEDVPTSASDPGNSTIEDPGSPSDPGVPPLVDVGILNPDPGVAPEKSGGGCALGSSSTHGFGLFLLLLVFLLGGLRRTRGLFEVLAGEE